MATVRNKADPSDPVDISYDDDQFIVAPSDTVRLRVPIQAVNVAIAGVVTIKNSKGENVPFQCIAGQNTLVGETWWVMATGTTATGITGIADKSLR